MANALTAGIACCSIFFDRASVHPFKEAGSTMEMLRDAFNNTAKVPIVIMYVDLTGATELKTSTPEVSWLPTFGWFFDQVNDAVLQNSGSVCKYVTSGVITTFPVDHAAQAINAAIAVQEKLREAKRDNTYRCNCSVGISTGKAVPFHNGQQQDFVGTSVDRAERLALGASPGAVFVDEGTVNAANMMGVFSIYGNAVSREGGEYLSASEKLPSASSSTTIAYREVLWDAQAFGVKSSTLTEMTSPAPTPTRTTVPTPIGSSEQAAWVEGRVARWDNVKGSGFITSVDGTTYYLHRDNLVQGVPDPMHDSVVFFLAEQRPDNGKNPRANVVVPVGALMGINLIRVRDKYGFAEARDSKGYRRDLFVNLGPEGSERYRIGQSLRVRIGRNREGPIGLVQLDEQLIA
jgi:class 3 adenylate cyclase/cold shock CspA family protein